MATASEVNVGMDAISAEISDNRAVIMKAISNANNVIAALGAIPEKYADVLSTINGYGTSDAFESLKKAELAKLTAEFTALVEAAQDITEVTP